MRLTDVEPILQDFLKIADQAKGKNPYENIKIDAYRRCFERVLSAPTVDAAQVVHGHWIIRNWGDWAECSRCHRTVDGAYDLNEYLDHISGLEIPDRMSYFCADAYCRCCGAKMDARPDNAEHCVACGDIIPEGRQVCPECESNA